MKNKFKFIFFILCFCILLVNNTIFASDNNFTKRIVSVVYDDSWSMNDNRQDFAYANYALQNIIGFMNENDELYVVRMSNKTQYEDIDLSSKELKVKDIEKISKWKGFAEETPFEAVETAVECLQEKKDKYGSADNIEYWLLVLTDGGFENMPKDVKEYLENFQFYMSDVKFESIYVFIGKQAYSTVKTVAEQMTNTTVISSSNTEDICRALFEAAEKIYGRTTLKGNDFNKTGNDVVFDFPFPVNKLIIYEQDQNVELLSVESNDGNNFYCDVTYSTEKINEPKLTSKIIEVKNGNSFIPSGKNILHFNGDIDISELKFQVMVDSAIALDLSVLDANGIKMDNEALTSLSTEDLVTFSVKPINPYDNSLIDLSNYANNTTAKYQYDNDFNDLSFDFTNKDYRFYRNLHVGQNNFSATLETKGFFKIKSNVFSLNISPVVKPKAIEPNLYPNDVSISNNYVKNYEKVSTLNFDLVNLLNKNNGTLEFSEIPKGIQIKVNGMTVKKNKVNLTLNEKNEIDIFRNKDYKGSEPVSINVNLTLKDKNLVVNDKGNVFQINPIVRDVNFNNKDLIEDFSNLNSGNAYSKNLYEITPMIDGKPISKDEFKDSKITFDNSGDKVKFKYKKKEDKDTISILVYMAKPLFSFGEKNVDTMLTLTTPYGEKATKQITFKIYFSIIDTILRILIPILVMIFIIGQIFKPRFEKTYHKVMMKKNGTVVYDEPIKSSFNIIPFKADRGTSCGLNLKADSSKNRVIILKNSLKENMTYDGDDVNTKKDLIFFEDTVLQEKVEREYYTYIYYDVRNKEDDEEKSQSRGRRRR